MKHINEDFQHIEELIRKVQSLIAPITVHKDFTWLMNRRNSSKFKEQFPKCVLPINVGRTIIYAPICNRMGAEDPEMIGTQLCKTQSTTPGKQEGTEITFCHDTLTGAHTNSGHVLLSEFTP